MEQLDCLEMMMLKETHIAGGAEGRFMEKGRFATAQKKSSQKLIIWDSKFITNRTGKHTAYQESYQIPNTS